MRVLMVYAHPVETSFCAALKERALKALVARGHEVEVLDLYEQGFDPVLTRAERLAYHDVPENRAGVAPEVEQLQRAEALVLVYPVWNFGFPAILKGYLDRVFLPGVSFRMEKGRAKPNLQHIRRLVAITTYGGARWRAFVLGDPPRRIVRRVLRSLVAPTARLAYLAQYDLNSADAATRTAFLERVEAEMARV
ncbi:NAD(P)H-dependent oxidoreductase [Stappia stellulata]|uniref:NAD(P)H-dependent oxidoreductase n=1 Tax=Stappia stellulata TaxID=71235 RepID=UPI000420C7D6|nr:NAD(P)H-dependent oxidoreductase [Stappia stellulata]